MESLEALGWYLSDHGYNLATDSGSVIDTQKMVKRLLDLDLREIGSGNGDINQGNIVLQIQKIRNVAAPKGNEESRAAPRMLKLSLTDGKNNFQALEVEHISTLSLNTPPGTKILIKTGTLPVSHGLLLLRPSHLIYVLGGKVANLVEKWELNKKLALHTRVRSAEEGGPPPWIPFGKKIVKLSEQDKNFKALAEKEKPSKENTEFETQRKDAIAEAAKQGSKKVFGGGNKQLLDHSVQKIVDRGFTIEQAEYALRVNRNNVDKALRSLQRTDTKHNSAKESREPREPRGKREKKAEESKPSSGKISLFDFLEDKLPVQPESVEITNLSQSSYMQNNESNQDRFESRGTEAQSGRGGRNQKGGRGYQPPPRYSEEHRNSKKTNNSNSTMYSQYNGASHAPQNKPPRFQRNQESQYQYQHDGGREAYQKSTQPNDYKNTFAHSRTSNANVDSGNDNYNRIQVELQGKNLGSNRNYNHLEPEAKNRHSYDASYNRHNRAQQNGTPKVYSTNTTEQNFKSQPRYQSNSNPGNKMSMNPNVQRNENYGNPNITGTWVWQVGDKCMAKYWEDNRYYNAEVTGVSERTCVVQFKGFENYEEVLQVDCIPITDDIQDRIPETRRQDQRSNNRQPRYDQSHNHINGMEFRRGGSGAVGGNKGYNKKRTQQRSTQPIYQPPAQRGHNSLPINNQNNTQHNSFL
ncbi:PREDICTED: tudor domain-containing protein 3 isoform X2 [Trachymyrmex septentrionalis]|uniref:tudor domain-containing protein 3 isoform X2 n=1 Tax=Trachymyrmex septentrionalis TaxID=34720 RepID=UPI00084F094D|nr:PREDICTED: tudor domain-containing protein 3 isoform X2 [Trachymyrmex septentrionalis]